jgi:hypothetical protein
MKMRKSRILLIGGVGLVKGRISRFGSFMRILCDELEPELIADNFCDGMPFDTVSVIFRFGCKDNFVPEYGRIDEKHQWTAPKKVVH